MIRVVMLGRLGNNLFQYAFARALAEKHGVSLAMDASWFNHRTWPFVSPLARFPGFTSGPARLRRPWSFGSRVLRKITGKHHWEYRGAPIVRERSGDHGYDPTLLSAPADCVLFGYFQTPLYFNHLSAQIRDELSTDGLSLESGLGTLGTQLREAHSVAVHVRRTDYVNNPNLVLLGTDYYQRAIERIRHLVPSPRFFVFSDVPDWCSHHFTQRDITVLSHSDPYQPLVDLHLMSLARHHIIANSSYSWWAAWLGEKPGQQVIMPDQWFGHHITAPAAEKKMPHWTMIPATLPH